MDFFLIIGATAFGLGVLSAVFMAIAVVVGALGDGFARGHEDFGVLSYNASKHPSNTPAQVSKSFTVRLTIAPDGKL